MTTVSAVNDRPFHLLVVGDLIIDEYIYGKSSRLSPEAPVPLLVKQKSSTFLGGAANVAANLAAHGCRVTLVSKASKFQETLIQSKWGCLRDLVDAILLDPHPHCEAPHKTRYYSGGQCVLRVDNELSLDAICPYEEDIFLAVSKSIAHLLQECKFDAIVASDYCKGLISNRLLRLLVESARIFGVPLFVDTKNNSVDCLDSNCILKPNLNELNDMVASSGVKPVDIVDLELTPQGYLSCVDALKTLSSVTGAGHIVLTIGHLGAIYYDDSSGTIEAHVTASCEVADVSGAGDTFFAAYIQSWLNTRNPAIACQAANYFAGCAVKVAGTYVPSGIDIFRCLRKTGRVSGIASLNDMAGLMAKYFPPSTRSSYSIGFTNGCFDILHPGHMRYLQEARDACDFLICGLNSDYSVRLLKGPTRPVLYEQYRAQALIALESVDLVIIFDAPSPEEIIHLVKPDILMKGGDYAIDKIVGADFVRSYGGTVFTIPFISGFSSSLIIDSFGKD